MKVKYIKKSVIAFFWIQFSNEIGICMLWIKARSSALRTKFSESRSESSHDQYKIEKKSCLSSCQVTRIFFFNRVVRKESGWRSLRPEESSSGSSEMRLLSFLLIHWSYANIQPNTTRGEPLKFLFYLTQPNLEGHLAVTNTLTYWASS